jgi:quercetin dioxygenase-like cupin family protein
MSADRRPIVLPPGGGRHYDMPGIRATFKADGAETADLYSISTWRLEPHCTGPGAHSHPEDDVFVVTEGVMSLFVGGEWVDAPVGTFVLVPGGATHDFQNRSDGPATVLNISAPGAFESSMPGIAEWFAENPPSYA